MGRNFYSLKFSLLIFAATLLSSCLSAPTKPSAPDPWWFHPCNSAIPKARHGRSTNDGVTVIKRQLTIFLSQLNSGMKKINRLYSNNKNTMEAKVVTPKKKFNWLKIKKLVTPIVKAKTQHDKLEKFHEALQHVAGTLDALRKIEIKTDLVNFDQAERDSIYANITFQLRSLLCECEYTLMEQKVQGKVVKNIPLKDMKIQMNKQLSLTYGQLHDINFFKKAISFFKRSQKLLFQSKSKSKKTTNRNKSAKVNKKRT